MPSFRSGSRLSKVAKGGEIGGDIASAMPGLVLAEGHVEHPMQFVFYRPVPACYRGSLGHGNLWVAVDVVRRLRRCFLVREDGSFVCHLEHE
jgi:hypothetical protein